ncbi:MAG: hypothetical protein II928_04140 [Paludibacteraceae bacterium]|nr:hypothetical protein [Paludibacteraceae bacterium]
MSHNKLLEHYTLGGNGGDNCRFGDAANGTGKAFRPFIRSAVRDRFPNAIRAAGKQRKDSGRRDGTDSQSG